MTFNTSRRGFLRGIGGVTMLGAAGCCNSWCGRSDKIRLAVVGAMGKGYKYPFVIENEGCNSSHTGNMGATMQGFQATILNTAPVVWPLDAKNGYAFDASALKPMKMTFKKDIPVTTMKDLGMR